MKPADDDENEKALIPIARFRARFSYDDLSIYVVKTLSGAPGFAVFETWPFKLLQPLRQAGLVLPEVAFLVSRFQHLPILNHHA